MRERFIPSLTILLFTAISAHAVDVIKSATGTDLSSAASWGGTTPGSSDIARWNSGSLGGTLTLSPAANASISWQGINLQDATTNITIQGGASGQTLVLGSSGINLVGRNLIFGATNSPTIRVSTNQTWTIGSGRRLLIDTSSLAVDSSVTSGGWQIVNNSTGTGASSGLTISANTGNFDFSKATISGGGSIFANGNSQITLTLGASNSFTGTTELRNTGTKTIRFSTLATGGTQSSFGAGTGNLVTLGNGGGAYVLENLGNGGSTSRVISLNSAATGLSLLNNGSGNLSYHDNSSAFNMTAGAVTLGGNFGQNSLATTIQGAGSSGVSLIKSGSNQWSLSATHTYTGSTSVQGGQLTITSSGSINSTQSIQISSAEFRYNSSTALTRPVSFTSTGGTVSGSGTINQTLSFTSGNIHSPGDGVGIQSIQSIQYQSGSILEWQLATQADTSSGGIRGTDYDGINVTDLSLDSATNFHLIQQSGVDFALAFWNQDREWSDIFQIAGNLTGGWNQLPVLVYNSSGDLIDTSDQGYFTANGTSLHWTAVPEPDSVILIGAFGLIMLFRRRI